MDGTATKGDVGRRISLFCVGLAVTAFSACVGWAIFALSRDDFYADWWQGWREAFCRLSASPMLATLVGLSAAFVGLGVVFMVRAVVGRRTSHCT